uniref:beta-N-acetylhexosaminidase n=1 Tax=Taeniopygia guttata TaxID=59729 RepID=H0Z7D1_TAEGU
MLGGAQGPGAAEKPGEDAGMLGGMQGCSGGSWPWLASSSSSVTGDVVQDIIPQSQVLELPAAKITTLKQKQQVSRDVSATEMRLVHLDLKGAAPRVSYLEQVFPLLSQLGANGVLMEYEDMFPFKGELEILRSPYAYRSMLVPLSKVHTYVGQLGPCGQGARGGGGRGTAPTLCPLPWHPPLSLSCPPSEEDIERIQQLAEKHKLEVVPLVQTFGHVEFILKHEKYQHLREVERFPNSFNPHVPDTLALLKSLLSQVIEKHRRSSWIHIGADEVFHLGEGMDSKNWMSHNKGDVGTMYLKHIQEVLGFLTAQFWGLRVLMWDDMLRKISVGALRESGIARHVSPVVWFYAPDFEAEQIEQFLTKYVESGFEAVWFASAFKGTTGPAQAWTPLSSHLRNHLSWLKVMQAVPRLAPLRLQGVVLTGWQRYDHYSVLCELLPVSIPSLAICLQTLVNGGFTEEAKRKVLEVLGLESVQLEQSACEGRGEFPGVEIYRMVEQVHGHLKESILKALEEERLHEDWEGFVRELRAQLERIYFPDTVEEWMEENVNPYLDQLRDLVRDYRAIIRLKGRPKAM